MSATPADATENSEEASRLALPSKPEELQEQEASFKMKPKEEEVGKAPEDQSEAARIKLEGKKKKRDEKEPEAKPEEREPAVEAEEPAKRKPRRKPQEVPFDATKLPDA